MDQSRDGSVCVMAYEHDFEGIGGEKPRMTPHSNDVTALLPDRTPPRQ
jgi:hypothetical protein